MLDKNPQSVRDILEKDGVTLLPVTGTSMWPLLRHDPDLVEVSVCSDQPRLNDVLLFQKDGKLILHRLIGKSANGYIARGDNRLSCERKIKTEDILGIMTGYMRGKKMKKPEGFFYKFYLLVWCRRLIVRRFVRKCRNFIAKDQKKNEY